MFSLKISTSSLNNFPALLPPHARAGQRNIMPVPIYCSFESYWCSTTAFAFEGWVKRRGVGHPAAFRGAVRSCQKCESDVDFTKEARTQLTLHVGRVNNEPTDANMSVSFCMLGRRGRVSA
ncbi:unnamed protein product [Hapterophycus canaliculatus]